MQDFHSIKSPITLAFGQENLEQCHGHRFESHLLPLLVCPHQLNTLASDYAKTRNLEGQVQRFKAQALAHWLHTLRTFTLPGRGMQHPWMSHTPKGKLFRSIQRDSFKDDHYHFTKHSFV